MRCPLRTIRYGDGSRYDLEDVAPSALVRAHARGDCRLRAVTVRYEPSATALCLNRNIRDGSPREIVQALVRASGITVEHADLMPADCKLTFSGGKSLHWLLNIVGDCADLYVDRIDAQTGGTALTHEPVSTGNPPASLLGRFNRKQVGRQVRCYSIALTLELCAKIGIDHPQSCRSPAAGLGRLC